jgi:hypothetical protein
MDAASVAAHEPRPSGRVFRGLSAAAPAGALARFRPAGFEYGNTANGGRP